MKILTIIFFQLFTIVGVAQKSQIILQLKSGASIEELNRVSDTNLQYTPVKQLSKSLNIWHIESRLNNKKEFLLQFQTHPHINAIQFNEEINYRGEPNDNFFQDQWQYFNAGDVYRTTDADIDAIKAWDITTGGLTATGDEIVVAVIDGGVNLQHPDLINNLWFNTNEIPGNKIDDDQNGFIDDYFGWNFYENNNNISNEGLGHSHGTPVAGIIGAEGNNIEGVCGVNWQVKVMNLVAKTVADVIAAYDYVLEMRKLYHHTNGKQGAFIVVTNASLGKNEGKPSDYPLWCAMYDALGAEGILNVAATKNSEINIDLKGDVPTSCLSNYLISVTSTDEKDKLNNTAYGKTHIDLGAPGSNVFTTTNNGYYNIFSGTSAAAPLVAGATALLYSVPNQLFMAAVHQNAPRTALLIKDFILNGTDPVSDLQHKTVSGGRLNLSNSICELENYFEDYGCLGFEEIDLLIGSVNLNTDFMNIQFHLEGETYVKIRLIDINGRLVSREYLTNINTGNHQLALPTQSLIPGIYYLVFNTKKNSSSKSIFIN